MQLETLIMQVESSAEWRADKAKQYPDDTRNVRCSEALSELAKNLSGLPAGNPHAMAYEAAVERLVDLDADACSRMSEHENRYTGRYGFDYPADGDPEEFLSDLTGQYQEWIAEAEVEAAEEERERAYEAAKKVAGEEAKEAAAQAAREVAEKAAKEAAEEAYREAYDETYKEAYEEAYREALLRQLNE